MCCSCLPLHPVQHVRPYPLSGYRQGCFPRRLWHSRPPCAALRAIHQEDSSLSKMCTLMVCCTVVLLRPCSGPPLNALQDVFLRSEPALRTTWLCEGLKLRTCKRNTHETNYSNLEDPIPQTWRVLLCAGRSGGWQNPVHLAPSTEAQT